MILLAEPSGHPEFVCSSAKKEDEEISCSAAFGSPQHQGLETAAGQWSQAWPQSQ